MMQRISEPKPQPIPEPTDETARRALLAEYRRRARGGRASTVTPPSAITKTTEGLPPPPPASTEPPVPESFGNSPQTQSAAQPSRLLAERLMAAQKKR